MRKIISKIAGTLLGLSLALGVLFVVSSSKDSLEAGATTESVSFISSGYTYNSTLSDLSGNESSNSGSKFWGMYGGATLTTKNSYSIDTTVATSISLHARKYGSVTGGKEVMTFNILDASSNSVLASNTLTPTSTTPTAGYSGTIAAFNAGTNKSVKFQLKSASNSSNGAFCGMTEASFTYTVGYVSTAVEATGISFSESALEVYAGESVSFTPTLTGGSGSFEKTISWSSSNTSIIANPLNTEDGEQVTVTPNNVTTSTVVTITGTVVSPGSASNSVLITVKPAKSIDHYSVTGSAVATTGSSSWDLSGLTLHAWYDSGETDEKTLVKGTDYSLTSSTAVGAAGTKNVTVTDSLNKISGSWIVSGTVSQAPVETEIIINTSNLSQVTTNTAASVVFTEGIVTFTINKSQASTNANNNLGTEANGTRVYSKTELVVSVSGANTYLKTVVLNKSSANNNAVTGVGTTWTGGTAVTGNGVLTVTANASTNSVSCSCATKSDIGSVVVTYTAPYQPVTGISLNKDSISMTSYDEDRILASALPANATTGGVTFGGYDTDIISVDENGNILPTGTKFGLTTVTITSKGKKSDDTYATATCSVNITRANFKEAKYSLVYSGNNASVSESGNIISGSSSSYSTTGSKFANADYIQGGQAATLTISGMEGYIVKSVVLKMKSQAEAGTGSLSVSAGLTTLKTIETAEFSDESWYGSYSSVNVLMKADMTNSNYEIQSNEDLVIQISVSVSGFHMTDYRVRYVKAGVPEDAVTFSNKVLTELTCNAAGTSAPSASQWNALRTYYLADGNVSDDAKTYLFEAAAADHDYDPLIDTTDVEIVAAAMAKYDYVLAKYGNLMDGEEKVYKDFINRNPAPLSGANSIITNYNNNSSTVVIVVVALTSISSIGVLLVIKRKRSLVK